MTSAGPAGPTVSAATRRAVSRAGGALSTAATRRIETRHDWYEDLSAEQRVWVAQVAQAGIAGFIEWLNDPAGADPRATFAAAPRELTRSISLAQTLQLAREVVTEVEDSVESLAATPQETPALREAVLRYSTEVAFGAAQVYASAAEQRGAWDARLESLVLDAVMRGEVDESLRTRATALGWGAVRDVCVVVGDSPHLNADDLEPEAAAAALQRAAAKLDIPALVGVQGERLVAVLGDAGDPGAVASSLAEFFGPGPLVHGPVVDDLVDGAISAAAAEAGHRAARGWSRRPHPVAADELLAERALLGDDLARAKLLEDIHRPLASNPSLLETALTHLDSRGGLEGTSRELVVHVNTVRYRLGRIVDLIGFDLADSHDAFTVRVALAVGGALEEPSKGED